MLGAQQEVTVDLLDIDEHVVPELLKLTKAAFDVDSIINAAGELKYVSSIKRQLSNILNAPDEDFVRFIASRVYEGSVTQKVRELFTELTRKAASQFLNDQANDRLKSAMAGTPAVNHPLQESPTEAASPSSIEVEGRVVTTEEEIEGFMIARAILRSCVDVSRIVMRDNQSYCAILLDDNNRKTVCRLHFNRTQKYIGFLDASRSETRHPISKLDELYSHASTIIDATLRLDSSKQSESEPVAG